MSNSSKKNPHQKTGPHSGTRSSRPISSNYQGGYRPSRPPSEKYQGGSGSSRPVSSNYQVDLFHHHQNPMHRSQRREWDMGSAHGPYPHPQEKSQQSKVRFNNEGKPSPKRGYTYHTFEVKDDLYKQFASKARDSSKSQKEVINQLISFFNMGKIKI